MNYTLEPWKMEYAASTARYADNRNIARCLRYLFPHPYTYEDAQAYIKSCIENGDERQLVRAIVVDGEAVGSIGVFIGGDVARKSAELGYWLAEPFWGRGIMTGAVKQMCTAAFERFDIVRIHADIFAFNKGSGRVLEKAGFVFEGTHRKSVYKWGQFHDLHMYALIK